jgi:hypothetical protein
MLALLLAASRVRPNGGTLVVFSISLQKAHVTYDRAHHIAFYWTGCCSWSETVLAYASPPPKAQGVPNHARVSATIGWF